MSERISKKPFILKQLRKHIVLYSVLGVVTLYVISLFTPFTAPFSKYPLFLIKCGGQPIVASDFAAAYSYDRPGDKYYRISIFKDKYFCTESEAQAAGYHHNGLNDAPRAY